MNSTKINIVAQPWKRQALPKRILIIRLQAMGDMVITLPYIQALRNTLPKKVQIDFLTRKEVEAIPKSLTLFDHVYSIGGKRNPYKQQIYATVLLPRLLIRNYDVVIDLQNNHISNYIRKILHPISWCNFDKYSPLSAGERTRLTIESIHLGTCNPVFDYKFNPQSECERALLKANGWNGESKLVLLNPAGAFATRNWSLNNYEEFAKLWSIYAPNTQYLILGTSFIAEKTSHLRKKLGSKLIDLVGKTTPDQAFRMMREIQVVLSEDSGLMHMAWVSGTPTVALFGSTRNDWSAPLGAHSLLFSSADLSCGNCLLNKCLYEDVHCLTRYSPKFIFEKTKELVERCV